MDLYYISIKYDLIKIHSNTKIIRSVDILYFIYITIIFNTLKSIVIINISRNNISTICRYLVVGIDCSDSISKCHTLQCWAYIHSIAFLTTSMLIDIYNKKREHRSRPPFVMI